MKLQKKIGVTKQRVSQIIFKCREHVKNFNDEDELSQIFNKLRYWKNSHLPPKIVKLPLEEIIKERPEIHSIMTLKELKIVKDLITERINEINNSLPSELFNDEEERVDALKRLKKFLKNVELGIESIEKFLEVVGNP